MKSSMEFWSNRLLIVLLPLEPVHMPLFMPASLHLRVKEMLPFIVYAFVSTSTSTGCGSPQSTRSGSHSFIMDVILLDLNKALDWTFFYHSWGAIFVNYTRTWNLFMITSVSYEGLGWFSSFKIVEYFELTEVPLAVTLGTYISQYLFWISG